MYAFVCICVHVCLVYVYVVYVCPCLSVCVHVYVLEGSAQPIIYLEHQPNNALSSMPTGAQFISFNEKLPHNYNKRVGSGTYQ